MKTRRGTRSSPRSEAAGGGGLEEEAPMSPAPPPPSDSPKEPPPKRTRRSAATDPPPPAPSAAAVPAPQPTGTRTTRSAAKDPPPPAPAAPRPKRGAQPPPKAQQPPPPQPEEAISVEALTGDGAQEASAASPGSTRASKRKSSALNAASVPPPQVISPPKPPAPTPAQAAQAQPPPPPIAKIEAVSGAPAARPAAELEAPTLQPQVMPGEPSERQATSMSDEDLETDVVGVEEAPVVVPVSPSLGRKYHVGSKDSKGSLRPIIYEEPSNTARGTRLIVEAPTITAERPFVETPLPGTADEVESYPCRFCPERVFLTSFGLEKHTQNVHPDALEDVMSEISRIQEEWKRREAEREKQKERLALAKIRQEALAAAAAREAMQSIAAAAHPEMEEEERGMYLPQTTLRAPQAQSGRPQPSGALHGDYRTERVTANVASSGGNFESCRICGLLINADHPTAMENHMRAHKKNDQLRTQLLATVGPEFVARVTCHECQLVFTDERKLIAHAENMHVRRRKYVCKWCGHVCLTMTDLNNHKADVHGMPVSRSRDPEARRSRGLGPLGKGRVVAPALGLHSAGSRRAAAMAEAQRSQGPAGSPRVLTSVEELPCRTTCDMCGLVMVKPSLLIRHMMRVHNRTNFTATVETKGMPSFRISVEQGKLSWTCCGDDYVDRAAFVYHRRMNHTPKLNPAGGTYGGPRAWNVDRTQQAQASASDAPPPDPLAGMSQEAIAEAAASGKTVIGEDGQQYMLMLVDEDGNETTGAGPSAASSAPSTQATSSAPTTTTATLPASILAGAQPGQQIVLTPEQLQELGISAADGENIVVMVEEGPGEGTDGAAETTHATSEAQPVEAVQGLQSAEGVEGEEGTSTLVIPEGADAATILSQAGAEGIVFVDERGNPIENTEGMTIRVNEQGEVELVPAEPSAQPPPQGQDAQGQPPNNNYTHFLNAEQHHSA